MNLGGMYLTGDGGQQSDTEAIKRYLKAAEQELALAQSTLGFYIF